MKKALIAGAASVALAAMPVVGVFAAANDITEVTDSLSISIAETCGFDGETPNAGTDATNDATRSYSAAATNGNVVDFNGEAEGTSAVHTFSVTCNNNGGWKVTAGTPDNLSGSAGNNHYFTYTKDALPTTGDEGYWTAVVGGSFSADATVTGIDSTTKAVLANGGIIATEKASAKASTFTVTYSAYAGFETPADTYTGSISYTLAQVN